MPREPALAVAMLLALAACSSATGAAIRITAHYDDPASDGCVAASDPGSLEGQSQRLTCDAKLVVEAVQYR